MPPDNFETSQNLSCDIFPASIYVQKSFVWSYWKKYAFRYHSFEKVQISVLLFSSPNVWLNKVLMKIIYEKGDHR